MLLEEFDPAPHAVIDPDISHHPVEGFPETVVSVFSHHLFASLLSFLGGRQIAETHDVDGIWPVYEVTYKGRRFGFYKGRLGAPACVGSFEDIWPMGMKRIILLGNCGVLDKEIQDCGIIIPNAAIRDEGTSYHYAPAADTIPVNQRYREEFKAVCQEHGYPYVEGTTWTTDAFYRETRDKMARRKAQGAICVEMECAAMAAFAEFRGLEFFQFFYAGDNLDHSTWDPRSLHGTTRLEDKEKIGLLAFELAVKIEERNAMNRVLVLGCPGAGKSTFARSLQEKTGLPIHYIDQMFWNADKTNVSKEELDARVQAVTKEDKWIIDGNYKRTIPMRLERADTVFYLDYPVDICLEGVKNRRGTVRPDMPWVETEEDPEFMDYIRDFQQEQRPEILEWLSQWKGRLTIFHNREEAEQYLEELKP